MKLTICILACVGVFMFAVGVLPNGATDAEGRMSNALMAFTGAGILALDGCILACWLLLRSST